MLATLAKVFERSTAKKATLRGEYIGFVKLLAEDKPLSAEQQDRFAEVIDRLGVTPEQAEAAVAKVRAIKALQSNASKCRDAKQVRFEYNLAAAKNDLQAQYDRKVAFEANERKIANEIQALGDELRRPQELRQQIEQIENELNALGFSDPGPVEPMGNRRIEAAAFPRVVRLGEETPTTTIASAPPAEIGITDADIQHARQRAGI